MDARGSKPWKSAILALVQRVNSLRQSTRVSFMGWLDTPTTLFSGLNAWIVVFDVEHEDYLEAVDLTSYVRGDHTHWACL